MALGTLYSHSISMSMLHLFLYLYLSLHLCLCLILRMPVSRYLYPHHIYAHVSRSNVQHLKLHIYNISVWGGCNKSNASVEQSL